MSATVIPKCRFPFSSGYGLPGLTLLILLILAFPVEAQVDEDATGIWYSWFLNDNIENSPWGYQLNVQRRNWELTRDLQQWVLLANLTWKPGGSAIRYGAGYSYYGNGTMGPDDSLRSIHVLQQQGTYSHTLGTRNYITHRLRLEEHLPEGREHYERLRYFIGLNRPLNQDTLTGNAIYLSFYNELSLNTRNTSFAFNRLYLALGYKFTDQLSIQAGYMHQRTRTVDKGQVMLSLFNHY